ncbi:WD40 repeat domain-containing protein [Streptomyces sp. NPDC020917]|uniref:WD40 repeat domain-containing protein n=1 Tax=Streptomyces sp. NPDC020917 TaxID=3365102 RepID=UPI0037AE4489
MLDSLHMELGPTFAEDEAGRVVPALSRNGAGRPVLLTTDAGYDVGRWDHRTGEPLWHFRGDALVSTLAVATPAGRVAVVAVGTDMGVLRVDAESGRVICDGALADFDDSIWDVTTGMLPGGRAFIAAATQCEPYVGYWDAATGEALDPPLRGPDRPLKTITSLTLTDGTVLIAAEDEAGVVFRWVAATGECFGRLVDGPGAYNMRMTSLVLPDRRAMLASLDMNGMLSRWNAVTGELLGPPLQLGSDCGDVAAACLGERGLLFVSPDGGVVRVLDAVTGQPAYSPIPGVNPTALGCLDGTVLLATVHIAAGCARLTRVSADPPR